MELVPTSPQGAAGDLTCSCWFGDPSQIVVGRVVAIDRFRLTLNIGDAPPPEWLRFGRTIKLRLEVAEESLELPVSVVRADSKRHPEIFVVQLRHLSRTDAQLLETLLGIVAAPKAPAPSSKGLRRRRPASPRPLPGHERRAHERFALNMDLWVEHEDITYVMGVKDISRGGMQCQVPLNEDPPWVIEGAKLNMTLFPADEESISFRGRIARVIPQSSKQEKAFGVAFDTVAAQVLVHRLLRKLSAKAA